MTVCPFVSLFKYLSSFACTSDDARKVRQRGKAVNTK